jgi:hypothetical protein
MPSHEVPGVQNKFTRKHRGRCCYFCKETFEAKLFQQHLTTCVSTQGPHSDPSKMLGLDDEGNPVWFVISGMETDLKEMLIRVCDNNVAIYQKANNFVGCSPQFYGRLFRIGWSSRAGSWAGPNGCSVEVSGLARGVFNMVDRSPFNTKVREVAVRVPMKELKCPDRADMCVGGKTQCLIGMNYSPVQSSTQVEHEPPIQVVREVRNMSYSCAGSCDTCKYDGCASCPRCTKNLSPADRSISFVLLYQHPNTPASLAARFTVGDKSFMFRGGAMFAFNGASVEHGVWAPAMDGNPIRFPWYSCTFVQQ